MFALPGVGQRGVADKLTYIFYLQPNFAYAILIGAVVKFLLTLAKCHTCSISQSFADMYTNGLLKESCSIDKEYAVSVTCGIQYDYSFIVQD